MRLTDSTQLHLLANGRFIAISEGTAPAKLVSTSDRDVFSCGWLYEGGYTEDGEVFVRSCEALAVGFDNGFVCLHGHDHRNDAEYFTAEEAHGALSGGYGLPYNARII